MESQKSAGLYFIGEVLDVTGHLGGFNFQWAWASASAPGQFASPAPPPIARSLLGPLRRCRAFPRPVRLARRVLVFLLAAGAVVPFRSFVLMRPTGHRPGGPRPRKI